MLNTMKMGMVGALTFVVMTGCGRAAQQPEPPAPATEGEDEDEVAMGYDSRPADQATGSVASYVPTESQKRVARVGDMLVGRIPGLEVQRLPNGDYTLRIRGPSTLIGGTADEEPLLVVDGTPVPKGSLSSTLSALQPRDIDRIDVLRDASTTAVYGMRGANGVIVITTKRPR
jgi:TonB-dependent starch-binding outer membrane protein SusC